MPTHSLLQCIESPDGHAQDALMGSGVPEPASSMTPHTPPSCMFCEQTFTRQDELGPHVLTQHPTTFYEPAVLRVEAEFRIPGERARVKASGLPVPREEVQRCIVCGLVSQDAPELEAHMRKHKDYFTFCCSVCGRRFREPWFLKTHMKMHAKAGSRSRAQPDPEAPGTVNGVVPDPPPEPVRTLYKMCMVCGFFFPDHEALAEHSKVHNRELDPGKEEEEEGGGGEEEGGGGGGGGASLTQETFLHALGLVPQPHGQPERSSKWIPQLDPFCTYQAWQLATRGKIAVGPNPNKDTGQEASTDNEEGGSDRDECEADKAPTAVLAPEPPPQAAGPETRRRCLMQRVKEKERPTRCEDCQRTFRTYHQLVLHSRIHKRERSGEESPTSADRRLRLEQAEEGCEEGLVEAMLSENPGAGEDGFGQTKARSKECNYCGKSFRSSYYLTIHLRTHTGEKPYKCAHCDYAAAQKTSLKYHLDRHHKDKRYAEIPSRPLASPLDGKPGEDADIASEGGAGALAPAPAAACSSAASEDSWGGLEDKPGHPPIQRNGECQKFIPPPASSLADDKVERPTPVNPKKDELGEEEADVPLNLSLKASLSVPPSALVPAACQFCAYRTFYPEVLVMHQRLLHKDQPMKKSGFGAGWKQKRLTGCPPALEGHDVAPLPMFGRRHPRRTKSPLRPAAKAREKLPVNAAPAPQRSPLRAPLQDVQESQHQAQPSRYAEPSRKGVLDRPGPPERVPASERSHPRGRGVAWHSDAARLCLSGQFGPLPPMDFGEPSSKRLKYMAAPRREAFPGAAGAGSSRLPTAGRGGRSASQLPSDKPGPSKTPAAVGGGLDGDWSMMNLLGSCSASDLASLYRSAPPPPAHAGLANPRAGGITVLYQHLPALPSLQRRDPAGLFPHQRYGTADKRA